MIVEDHDMSGRFFAFGDGARSDHEDSLPSPRCGIRQPVGSNHHYCFLKRSKIAFHVARNFFRQPLSKLLPEIPERFEIVHDVCHGSAYAFAATQRGQVRDFFASADGQSKRAFSYPRLFNLYGARDVLDKFVNCRLVVLAGCEPWDVQEIEDWLLLQQ
jgi:hypothetical protein